jgi:hypothetical protein
MVAKTFATLIGTTVIAATITAFPFHVSADQAPAPGMVACADPFGREATRSDLVRAFGAANVVDQEIEVHEGAARWGGTVVYPNDPRRRLEVFLDDLANGRGWLMTVIRGKSQWTGWRNVHVGMTLEEVEVLNGKPFMIHDFNNFARGTVFKWQGGAMERIPGGCRFGVRFKPDDGVPSDAVTELAGDVLSSDPKVRSLRLTVSEIYTYYQPVLQ